MTEQRSEQPSRESVEWLSKWVNAPAGEQLRMAISLDALLDREKAKAALAEAKWWHMQRGHHGQNWCCDRVAALEQAVAGKQG